jgi:hypothetical protein
MLSNPPETVGKRKEKRGTRHDGGYCLCRRAKRIAIARTEEYYAKRLIMSRRNQPCPDRNSESACDPTRPFAFIFLLSKIVAMPFGTIFIAMSYRSK